MHSRVPFVGNLLPRIGFYYGSSYFSYGLSITLSVASLNWVADVGISTPITDSFTGWPRCHPPGLYAAYLCGCETGWLACFGVTTLMAIKPGRKPRG